jgi:hypothetical protein
MTILGACALFSITTLMAETKIEKTSFFGWPNCYRISNGTIELIAISDIGPRIISIGFVGGKNLFRVFEETQGKTGGDKWNIYGGHRLWHSPEDKVRTYELDNSPVKVEPIANGLRFTQDVESHTGILKTIEVTLDPSRAEVRLVHRMKNTGLWPIEFAAWALSVMERGGFAIMPLPTRHQPDNLLSSRSITLWPYTDMSDPRYLWGKDFILMRQVPGKLPTKIGVFNNEEWLAYYLEPYLFVKRFKFVEGARYPDRNSSAEMYTNQQMLEMETVGPLEPVQPQAEIVHEEVWQLYKDIRLDFSEESVRTKVMPLLTTQMR